MIRSQLYGYRRARGVTPKPTHHRRSGRGNPIGQEGGAYRPVFERVAELVRWMLHRGAA